MERQKTARSSKWGEACAPCAIAKTRCIRNRDDPGASCDRCLSLSKDCSVQVQKPRKKRHARPSRTAQLEERLNSLIQAMSSTGEAQAGAVAAAAEALSTGSTAAYNTSSVPHTASNPSSVSPEPESGMHNQETPPDTGFGLPSSLDGAAISPHCTCRVPVSKSDLVPKESDETLLAIFVNQLSPKFPFVIIPPGTTVEQMQATRPFLMKVIRMVGSVRHLSSMWGQSRAVIKSICDAMLIRSERSLDLLQGILVFLGFYHYFCMSHAHFNNLAHLALSLVGDMGLSAAPRTMRSEEVVDDGGGCRPRVVPRHPRTVVFPEGSRSRRLRTNDERRALLGVWYINSNATSVVKQLGPTRYTKYIAECLVELEQAAEYPTDQLAVELVRIQHLTETVHHFHTRDQLLDELPGLPRLSTTVYLEALLTELDRKRAALPAHLQTDPVLCCHYNNAKVALFVPLLAEEYHLADASLKPLENFGRFTAALRMWFADWFAIPVCSYFYLPQPVSSMLVHASRRLVQWVRLVGPSAVQMSSTTSYNPLASSTTFASSLASSSSSPVPTNGSFPSPSNASTSASSTSAYVPRPRYPAFMGIPSCPTLDVSSRPTIISGEMAVAAQAALDMIRAAVYTQPELRLDTLGIADAMVVRFESAQKEIAAAQGGVWKNDTWNAAGDQMRIKKFKIEQWIEIASKAGADIDSVPLNFGPLAGELYQEFKWPTELPEGIELEFSTLLDSSNDWNTDWNAQAISMDS
ncbi:hypothetical protein SBRCBS47491_006431 [Sporothrix bragantina]|uniref:Zn(2)-C6 fungal-type domain-containing protein n=1 Tax=Sporothrix bragantina TaxID=671064 RepID=A0ABP0C7A4_9PEZI